MAETTLLIPTHSSTSRSTPSIQLSIMDEIFSRKSSSSFLYNRLRSEPLTLSVLKLDGSTFDIQVAKTATVAEVKGAVKAVFSHMPKTGPGKISWPHVWGQFCLCYDGQKLITDDDYIRDYGIKDGDQLRFIRHVSNNYGFRRKRLKKRVFHFKQHKRCRSSSQVNSYQPKENRDGDVEFCSDNEPIDDGKIHYIKQEVRSGKNKLTNFIGELFSYNQRLPIVRKPRTKSRFFGPSKIARCLLSNFRKIRRIVSSGSRRARQNSTWRRY